MGYAIYKKMLLSWTSECQWLKTKGRNLADIMHHGLKFEMAIFLEIR